ncbi:hypothetical protein [Peptoniphilus asaccharolyticus]
MKFKNTFEKYDLLESFYYILDELVQVKDSEDLIYSQIYESFGPQLPKSIILFDRHKNKKALNKRFMYFIEKSLYDAEELWKPLSRSYFTVLELFDNQAEDRLIGKNFKISNLPKDVSSGEFLLCRILEIDEEYFIYGDYVPVTFLHGEAIIDEFKRLHPFENLNPMQLKYMSYDLFMLYFVSSLDENIFSSDVDLFVTGAISTLMFNKPELSLFMEMSSFGSEKFFYATELLSIFYLRILLPKNQNYSSFKRINFHTYFKEAVERGCFKNETELIAVLDTMTEVYKFFSRFREDYKTAVSKLKEVKQDIFNLMDDLKNSMQGFYYDEKILKLISTPQNVISDLDTIENTIESESITESITNGSLTSKSVQILAEAVDIKPTKKVVSYTSYHFPYIDFLYRFLKFKDLVDTYDEVIISHLFDDFINLEEDEILAILYNSIFNIKFLEEIYPPIKVKEYVALFNKLFSKLKNEELLFDNLDDEEKHFVDAFYRIGLLDVTDVVKLSTTAINLINYNSNPSDNIISLSDYR